MNDTLKEIVETQKAIIDIQAEVIGDLFLFLSERVPADELDRLPAVEKINLAASLRADISRLRR